MGGDNHGEMDVAGGRGSGLDHGMVLNRPKYIDNRPRYKQATLSDGNCVLDFKPIGSGLSVPDKTKKYEKKLSCRADPFYCEFCDKSYAKDTVYNAHLTGKKHIKGLRKAGTEEALAEAARLDVVKNNRQKVEAARREDAEKRKRGDADDGNGPAKKKAQTEEEEAENDEDSEWYQQMQEDALEGFTQVYEKQAVQSREYGFRETHRGVEKGPQLPQAGPKLPVSAD